MDSLDYKHTDYIVYSQVLTYRLDQLIGHMRVGQFHNYMNDSNTIFSLSCKSQNQSTSRKKHAVLSQLNIIVKRI